MNCYRMRVRNVLLLALGLLAILPPYHQDGVAAPRYGAWSAPANLGSFVNTEFAESGPHTSKDGRTLYFSSTRPACTGRLAQKTSGCRSEPALTRRGDPQ